VEDEGVIVECTIYPLQDTRQILKSSITGRPMKRAHTNSVKKLIEDTASSSE
jgi:hypothetical protein